MSLENDAIVIAFKETNRKIGDGENVKNWAGYAKTKARNALPRVG